MPVIELSEIGKVYGFGEAATIALSDVDLKIEAGEFVAVMGPSGSGKSTLLNIIGLLDTPTVGSYTLDGLPVAGLSESKRAKIRRERISFIFQSFNLLQRMTVIDNVALPLMYSGTGHVDRLERASEILAKLGMAEREYYYPGQLSGGQTQRAAIARALVNDPTIILADEPTGNLDTKTGEKIMTTLEELNKEGNTVIMVTHDDRLTKYAHRIIHVIDGTIVEKSGAKGKNTATKAESKSKSAKTDSKPASKSKTKKAKGKKK